MSLWSGRTSSAIFVALGLGFVLFLIGTGIAGSRGAVQRETLVRARVWCEALVERDALRYQETFRRNYFRGRFDRFANIYRDPTEASILAQMPKTNDCRIADAPRTSIDRSEVFVPVERSAPAGAVVHLDLRMRREAGFWVVYQLVERE